MHRPATICKRKMISVSEKASTFSRGCYCPELKSSPLANSYAILDLYNYRIPTDNRLTTVFQALSNSNRMKSKRFWQSGSFRGLKYLYLPLIKKIKAIMLDVRLRVVPKGPLRFLSLPLDRASIATSSTLSLVNV